ncbi:MAG: kinase/pyrophosphorylase [Peptococcaceae bacterium]|nr:kinase/pyrophosphorylase [Peptococcaceae bacterium]
MITGFDKNEAEDFAAKPQKPVIFTLSDSVGDTAEVLVRAAVSQFDSDAVEIRLIPFVDSTGEISDIVEEAGCYNSLIVYTLVMPELREALAIEAERHGIPTLDILNPVIDAVSDVIQCKPKMEPGLVRKTDEEYYRKVDAVEFAVRCDDGKNAVGITQADLVVLGVSRTSKTPLCMYLAHKRILTANVPLVPEVAPPEELFLLPPHKIIGLSIQPQQLNEIRQERLKTLGITAGAKYVSMERINEELAYADNIMKRIGCKVIDVTNKAVEETASKVLEIYYRGNI